jgi:16S rRNA C967 or C1407 C5-methylase (RsmB/RsmF family)
MKFEEFFTDCYGERWPDLRRALLEPAKRTQRKCFNGYSEYTMDYSSVLAAEALAINPDDRVLDMCAAPGGKTLVCFEKLVQGRGTLTANELSFSRRKRLEEVIRTHVPIELQSRIRVTSMDGEKVGIRSPESFDKILIDAPCSSERHCLEQDSELKDWKVSRTENLARRQYALICSAILALKSGGELVYSTCSISPLENDGVLDRVFKRKGDLVERLPVEWSSDLAHEQKSLIEPTQHGVQIFPDRSAGLGPMYIARLKKRGI